MRTESARRPLGAALLVPVLVGSLFWWPSLTEVLQFDRSAIAHGEWWRWLTGHLTHWSFEHLFWDVLAFGALASLCERKDRTGTLQCLLLSSLAISTAIWALRPEVVVYWGLSGVNAALFVFLGVSLLRDRGQQLLASCSLLAFMAKMGYEMFSGQSLFVSEVAMVELVPLAHVIGSLTGALLACFLSPGWLPRPPARWEFRSWSASTEPQ